MKILNQKRNGILFSDNIRDIFILKDIAEKAEKPYLIRADIHMGDAVPLGRYSSNQKAQVVLGQIFEHKGNTFIMPQDDEVEI